LAPSWSAHVSCSLVRSRETNKHTDKQTDRRTEIVSAFNVPLTVIRRPVLICCILLVYKHSVTSPLIPAWHYLFTMIEWIDHDIDVAGMLINGCSGSADRFTARKSMLGTKPASCARQCCSLLLS